MKPFQLSLFAASPPMVEAEDIETRADRLVDWLLQEWERQGLDRAAQQQLLMRLQVRSLVDNYLVKIPPGHRWQFVAHLIDAIHRLELDSSGS